MKLPTLQKLTVPSAWIDPTSHGSNTLTIQAHGRSQLIHNYAMHLLLMIILKLIHLCRPQFIHLYLQASPLYAAGVPDWNHLLFIACNHHRAALIKSIMRSKIHKKRLAGSRLEASSHGFGHRVGSTSSDLFPSDQVTRYISKATGRSCEQRINSVLTVTV